MNTFSKGNKLLAPTILTKNLIDEQLTSSIETINLQWSCNHPEEETHNQYEGAYRFGGQSVQSLFSSHITLQGSAIIEQTPLTLGVCSINLLDSSMKETIFQKQHPIKCSMKLNYFQEQQSIEGIQMNIDDYLNDQENRNREPGPLIVNEISKLNCSLFDSDDE